MPHSGKARPAAHDENCGRTSGRKMRPQKGKYAAARAAAAWNRTQLGARPHFRTQSAAARTFPTRNYLPMLSCCIITYHIYIHYIQYSTANITICRMT